MKTMLGDAYSVGWKPSPKPDEPDLFTVAVFGNATGDMWTMVMTHDDFKFIDPEIAAKAAMESLFDYALKQRGI